LSDVSITQIGFVVVIVGFIMAFVAVVLLAIRSTGTGKTRGGGVLLIGPIPIIFGTDRESTKVLMVLAVILIVVVLVFMLLPSLLLNR
jgi:uncharacterized protein (TIGR00304 family)